MKKVFLEMYLNGNLGDDLFLKILMERYSEVIFDACARKDCFKGFGYPNLHRQNYLKSLIGKFKSRIGFRRRKKYDAGILLGGSMFIEGNKNKQELRRNLNSRYGGTTPLFVLGANFGPYRNQFYYNEYKKRLFARAEDVCFRDKYSAGLFSGLKNVRVAPDIIFGLDVANYFVKQEKKVVISVINLETRDGLKEHLAAYENKIVEIADWYAARGYEVLLMSFCKYEGDEEAIERILKKVSSGKVTSYYYSGNIDETLKQIASSEIVIGTRFHAVVLGLVFNKKVLPIIYSDKTKNMLNDIGFNGKLAKIEDIGDTEIAKIDMSLTRYDGIEKLRKGAERHFEKLDRFLDRN